ncbi:Tripartite tricarboxylate transporter TctA family protein [Candidatus Bilamarchaeum dharawalense]|uniref:Tripartite tricarboxylate transporter TctA family protein n=1 Tax=Candidatus Bilamarchaeum dharawalense TaxID=2885759 RepID=A0A5E4LSB0_9ARCH|nr:Tripartite tricarboxylate transporter TctA family protein [Candidatus Bilamarchaeum dharawalense]
MGDFESFCIGLLTGFVSGFFPGLHPNMIIPILSSLGIDDRTLAILIISLYPANLISSFIPSIFFGVPDGRTVVTILPGQRMVLEGKGLNALKVVLFSSIVTALLAVGVLYFSLDFFSWAYEVIRKEMSWILLAIVILLLARGKKPHFSAFVFILSGLLGKFSLGSDMVDPFLPLFSGMFTIAAILNYRRSNVPKQDDEKIEFDFGKFIIIGIVLGMLADLIPGIGSPAQMATFATIFLPINTLGYLATISSISVSQAIFSLATSASIGKSRVGAMIWLAESIDIGKNLPFLIGLFILSMAISIGGVYLIRKQAAGLAGWDFSKMNIILSLYLFAITFVIDGWFGLGVLIISAVLGWLTIKLGVERTMLMGSIIIPTLLLLFRIF